MSTNNAAFVGSIPENYDRHLGSVFFEPYADDLTTRVNVPADGSLLELACGTGIVTRRLRDHLPESVRLVATDLNEPMMKYAARKFRPDENVEWQQVDATELPFDDESFDVVICQFGMMFFPDKAKAAREAFRVTKPGGIFLFNVWDAIEFNDLPRIAHGIVTSFFDADPPDFYDVPFSFYHRQKIRSVVEDAGFSGVQLTTLPKAAIARSAPDVAIGLVEGNPIITAIREHMESKLPEIKDTVASEVRIHYGNAPVRAQMQAVICSARK